MAARKVLNTLLFDDMSFAEDIFRKTVTGSVGMRPFLKLDGLSSSFEVMSSARGGSLNEGLGDF
jgi:hypothetical protein